MKNRKQQLLPTVDHLPLSMKHDVMAEFSQHLQGISACESQIENSDDAMET